MEYCISDIHGHYELFCRLMDKIKFSGGDRLYVLGDVIDKGPDSVKLLRTLLSMRGAECIAGNHEYDFLKYYRGLLRVDTDIDEVYAKLRAYFPDGRLLDSETVDALDLMPFYIETDKFIGVHAGLPLRQDGTLAPIEEATCEQLVYDRRFKDSDVLPQGGKCVLFGHTPVRYLTGRDEIALYPRAESSCGGTDVADYCKVHLDTGVPQSGVLGCFAVDTCRCYYVSGR